MDARRSHRRPRVRAGGGPRAVRVRCAARPARPRRNGHARARRLAGAEQRTRAPARGPGLRARLSHGRVAGGQARRRRRRRDRDRCAAAERRLPERVLLRSDEELLRLHGSDRARERRPVRRSLVVSHGLRRGPSCWRTCPADRQRGARRGRPVGQRPRARHARHPAGRLRALQLRNRRPAARGGQLARPGGLPERPHAHAHARRRRLEPDPARQQHRDPVPAAAAHLRRAGDRGRARARGQRPRPVELAAHAQGRSQQRDRHHAERHRLGDRHRARRGRRADHALQDRDGAGPDDKLGFVRTRGRPATPYCQPSGVVAVSDGFAAAVRTVDTGRTIGRAHGLPVRDVRDPHRQQLPHRRLADRAARRAPVRDQRAAARDPRGRLVRGPVPALLRRQHRRADRADREPRAERDPHRGQGDARRLLRADGPRRHPHRRRLSML
jgi:hypothetical protein